MPFHNYSSEDVERTGPTQAAIAVNSLARVLSHALRPSTSDWENPTDCILTIGTDAMSVEQAFTAIREHFSLQSNR